MVDGEAAARLADKDVSLSSLIVGLRTGRERCMDDSGSCQFGIFPTWASSDA
jgi:hypothetical protein